ncbi:MAG: thermonuclease family protein [Thiolinea sp.]
MRVSIKLTMAGMLYAAILPLANASCVVPATIVAVLDGDTVRVVDSASQEYLIGLIAANAPQPGQPHADEATEHLATMIQDQPVCLDPMETDDQQRVIAKVHWQNKDVSLEMLKAGYAWYDTIYQHLQTDNEIRKYSSTELRASIDSLGLWENQHPIPPWNWTLSSN